MGLDAAKSAYQTGFSRWRAADEGFDGWQRAGVDLAPDGALRLDPATVLPASDPYPPGGYNGRNFYNGGSFLVGEALGPIAAAGFGIAQAIVSWNADTPTGTWIETQLKAQALGGNLVTINNAAENEWVRTTFANYGGNPQSVWIGLTDRVTEGAYQWADGTPVAYTNWNPGEPNDLGNEDYVAMNEPGTGGWNDAHSGVNPIFEKRFPHGQRKERKPSVPGKSESPGVLQLELMIVDRLPS